MGGAPEDDAEVRQRITEIGVGITLVGVICNMGLTIGLSLSEPLAIRIPLAIGSPLLLMLLLGLASRRIQLLSMLPWWLTRHGPEPWQRLGDGDE
jgi:hypothetical protein